MSLATVANINNMIHIPSLYSGCNENDVLQIIASSQTGYTIMVGNQRKKTSRKSGKTAVKIFSGDSSVNIGKNESLVRLEEIKSLPDNWNGNGAKMFSPKFISYVRAILTNLDVEPDVFPTARDSIQLEYENSTGDYLEFEIFEDRKIKKFFCGSDGKTSTNSVSETQLNEIVSHFYG